MKTLSGVFKNKKSLLFLSVFFLILLPVSSAHALGWDLFSWDGLTNAIIKVIYVVSGTVILYGVGLLARIGAFLVDIFLDPNLYDAVLRTGTTEDPTAIQVGWTTVRDFCNMFYVFFLLLIAFATITRNQAYSAKNLLPKIVISMLLINFSMVITKIVIDFGQVFLFGIASWMGTFSGPDGAAAGLTSVVDYFQDSFPADRNPDKADVVVAMFAVGYTFMLALLYIILAGFLAIRLVYFVVLIIVSPFAFFSMVLPSMKTYASKWWHMLVNNAISGPIFMFFVYLSAVMAQNLTAPNYPPIDPNLNWIAGTIHLLIPHFIALVMLWMAIPATQFIGAAGSKQLIGGTMGMGKAAALVGFGAAAGYKVARGGTRAVGGVSSRYMASELPGADKARGRFDSLKESAKKNRYVGNAVIKRDAEAAAKKKNEVENEEKLMATLSDPDRKRYADNALDPRKKALRNQAHMNLLAKGGGKDLTNERLKEMGYTPADLQKFYQQSKNYGLHTGEIDKYRPDVISDDTKRQKKITDIIAEGEEGKIKAESLKNDKDIKTFKSELGEERFESWRKKQSAKAVQAHAVELRRFIGSGRDFKEDTANFAAALSIGGTHGGLPISIQNHFSGSPNPDDFKKFIQSRAKYGLEGFGDMQLNEAFPHITRTHLANSSKLDDVKKRYLINRVDTELRANPTDPRLQDLDKFIKKSVNWKGAP